MTMLYFGFLTYLVLSIGLYIFLKNRIIQLKDLRTPLLLNLLRSILWTPGFIGGYGFIIPIPAVVGGLINSEPHLIWINWLLVFIFWIILMLISIIRIAIFINRHKQ